MYSSPALFSKTFVKKYSAEGLGVQKEKGV
jgi:hypothetical protein